MLAEITAGMVIAHMQVQSAQLPIAVDPGHCAILPDDHKLRWR
jgi:hypothetical protein